MSDLTSEIISEIDAAIKWARHRVAFVNIPKLEADHLITALACMHIRRADLEDYRKKESTNEAQAEVRA